MNVLPDAKALVGVGVAYQLTGAKAFADKVATAVGLQAVAPIPVIVGFKTETVTTAVAKQFIVPVPVTV